MKTVNRQTASRTPLSPTSMALTLANMQTRVRKLWSRDLDARGDRREQLITSLNDVDLGIERLAIRRSCGLLQSIDIAEVQTLESQLFELESRWRPPPEHQETATA